MSIVPLHAGTNTHTAHTTLDADMRIAGSVNSLSTGHPKRCAPARVQCVSKCNRELAPNPLLKTNLDGRWIHDHGETRLSHASLQ